MTVLMPIWTVYDHPRDWPAFYVARKHVIIMRHCHSEPTEHVIMDKDIERIRAQLAGMGLVKLDRFPEDDPVILETWL